MAMTPEWPCDEATSPEDGRICAQNAVLRPDTPFEGQDSHEASEGLIRENHETATGVRCHRRRKLSRHPVRWQ